MRLTLTVLNLAILLGMLGCRTRPEVYPICYAYELSEQQVAELTSQAIAGDPVAARRLYQFHAFVTLDAEATLRWLTRASELGDATSEYNLGMFYSGYLHADHRGLSRARYWFERAAQNGNADAPRRLAELEHAGLAAPATMP